MRVKCEPQNKHVKTKSTVFFKFLYFEFFFLRTSKDCARVFFFWYHCHSAQETEMIKNFPNSLTWMRPLLHVKTQSLQAGVERKTVTHLNLKVTYLTNYKKRASSCHKINNLRFSIICLPLTKTNMGKTSNVTAREWNFFFFETFTCLVLVTTLSEIVREVIASRNLTAVRPWKDITGGSLYIIDIVKFHYSPNNSCNLCLPTDQIIYGEILSKFPKANKYLKQDLL